MRDIIEHKIEETTVFKMGNKPGECYAWECICQAQSGLEYGSEDAAWRGLEAHQTEDHPK